MLSAITLAAGKSSRMGRPKQLMPWRQGTIVEQTVDNLLDSEADEVIVVVGYKAEEVKRALADKPIKLAVNPYFEQGVSKSIIIGLGLVDSQAQAVMIVLGDQPLINSRVIDSLIEEFYKGDKGIVVPAYQGRRGHPVVFGMKYKEELLGLRGDVGARRIIEAHAWDTLEVPVNCKSICIDIDTMEDYFYREVK